MNVRRTLPSLASLIAIGVLAAACSTPSSTAGWTYGPTIAPQPSASASVAPLPRRPRRRPPSVSPSAEARPRRRHGPSCNRSPDDLRVTPGVSERDPRSRARPPAPSPS